MNELSPGGVVCSQTLDGEPMTKFISGSLLKKYHEPLAQDMLSQMHEVETRKRAVQHL